MIQNRLQMIMEMDRTQRRIRVLLIIFIAGLLFSGLTALPIELELKFINESMRRLDSRGALSAWIERAYEGVRESNAHFPFLSYGTDWLAFGHFVIAFVFAGPLRDPIKNKWVIESGMIACAAVLPWALITGHTRDIPLFWRLFDCLFGIAGGSLLIVCYFNILKLETLKKST